MSHPIKMKDLTAFLDRNLPLAGLNVTRTERGGPIIYTENYPAMTYVQQGLREALKLLVYYAPNYGVDKSISSSLKAFSEKPFATFYPDNMSLYLAWKKERIIFGGWYNRAAFQDEEPQAYNMFRNPDSEGHQGAIQIAREHYWCDDEAVFRAPRYSPTVIYNDYLAWCNGDGITPWGIGTFRKKFKSDALDNGGVWKKTGADGRHWRYFDFVDGHAHARPKTRP